MEDRQVKLSEDFLILSTEIWILRLQKNGFAEQKVDMTLSISKRITDMHMIFLRFYADALSFLAFLSRNKNRSRFLSVIFVFFYHNMPVYNGTAVDAADA